jgi:thymidylate synthase
MEIQTETGDQAYRDLLTKVHDHGEVVSPRGFKTWELRHATIIIRDPVQAPPVNLRSGYSEYIAATELCHLLAGVSHLGQLDAASHGRFTQFADGGRLRGAYGPRLFKQLLLIEDKLRRDPDTRQAVATIWRPDELTTRDTPCTLTLTFSVRHGLLELKVHMRSNDLVLGVPYDWFMFSRLQLAMAQVLGVRPGPYVHHVDSLHLYERDDERARTMVHNAMRGERGHRVLPAFTPLNLASGGLDEAYTTWSQVQSAATAVLWHRTPANWFTDRVERLTDEEVICVRCQYVVPRNQLRRSTDDTLVGRAPVCYECWTENGE